ncbi:MAG: YoaK family protein, partial [Microthrixaceae bacterium]
MAVPVRRPETVAILLAMVSGFVDAFIYLRVFPVFTANQSGNLILAGIAIGQGHWAEASASAVSLVAYVLGAAIGVAAFDRALKGGRPRLMGALAAEIVVLVALVVTAWLLGRGNDASSEVDAPVLLIIAVTAVAMGLQGMALRKVRNVGVLTTGGTGNVTTIGERLARLGTRERETSDELALDVIGWVVALYVGGAVLGSLASSVRG